MKKLITYGIAIIAIIWSISLAINMPVASAAYSPVSSDLIKTATNPAVYYIDLEAGVYKRHLFSNAVTFWTWYSGSWADQNIKTITQNDFDNLRVGNNITARPGANLIKFSNSSKIYAIMPGSKIIPLDNNDPAVSTGASIFGSDWSKRIITIQSGFENDYIRVDSALPSYSRLPEGSLIQYNGSSDIYYISGLKKHKLTGQAFVVNGFKENSIIKNVSTNFKLGPAYPDTSFETGEDISGLYTNATIGSEIDKIACSLSGICPMVIKDIKSITKLYPSDMTNVSIGVLKFDSQHNLGGFNGNNSGVAGGVWTNQSNIEKSGPVWIEVGCNTTPCNRPAYNIAFLDENNIERKIYIPASNNRGNTNYQEYYWVAEDGSTYYANSGRGHGQPDLRHDLALNLTYQARPTLSVGGVADWNTYTFGTITNTRSQLQQTLDAKRIELAQAKSNLGMAQHERGATGYTGNVEGFEAKIVVLENEIKNLEDQIAALN